MARRSALLATTLILGVLGLQYLFSGGDTSSSEIANTALVAMAIAWALVFVGLSIKEL